MICIYGRRYLFDIKARKEHSKIYELWRKETTNEYLAKNLEKNSCQNQDVLRNKSILNRFNCMSHREEELINKVDDIRVTTKKLKTFIANNDVEFIKNNIVHTKYEISEENKLNMKKKVNRSTVFISYYFVLNFFFYSSL